MSFNSHFADITVTGEQIVAAARGFVGLRYSSRTFVDAKGAGFCDCAGLFLLVAQKLELLPLDFDPNLPPAITGMSREDALKAILRENFVRFLPSQFPRSEWKTGDSLIFKWPGQAPGEFGRHTAIWTGDGLIHAINRGKTGHVREELLEAHLAPLVWRVYRLINTWPVRNRAWSWEVPNGT